MQEITTQDALARVAAGARLYDVREQGEWDEVHAPRATLVPLSEFAERWTEIESSDEPAIVVCHSGVRSARAVQALEQQGIPAVNLSGGMVAWQADGGPVVHPGTGDADGERGHEH